MAHTEPRKSTANSGDFTTTSLINRFIQPQADWLKTHTPDWFWKTLMFHDEGLLTSDDPERSANFAHLLIILASIAILVLLIWK